MKKFDELHRRMKRRLQHDELPEMLFTEDIRLQDILLESLLPSPYRLLEDITSRVKTGEKQFKYTKKQLLELSSPRWTTYSEIEKLPDRFFLEIIVCSENVAVEKFKWLSRCIGQMMEFGDPEDPYAERIWMREDFIDPDDDGFKNLLKHELGHVWTYVIGDEKDNRGIGPSSNKKTLDPSSFTHKQKIVYKYFYNLNLKVLQDDYIYILCKTENDPGNLELPVHIDNIIEILVDDYLEHNEDSSEEAYMDMIFKILDDGAFISRSFSLVDLYNGKLKLRRHRTLESVRNPIRRLMLILAFGTPEQIAFLRKALEEEFGDK